MNAFQNVVVNPFTCLVFYLVSYYDHITQTAVADVGVWNVFIPSF